MATKKEYGWVDYTNLALNVVQTAQLENVRHQLAQLQQVHLDERIKVQIRDQLRQKVFEIDQVLKELLNLASKVPLQLGNSSGALVDERGNIIGIGSAKLQMFVYMNCSQLMDYFVKTGIGAASFSDFNDKDRVQKVLLELDEAINKTYEQLDQSSRNEVDECRRFINEEADLQDLIGWLKSLKEKMELDPEAAQIELLANEAEINEKEKSTKPDDLNASIIVTRTTELAYMVRKINILINSQEIGKVSNNQTATFSILPGKHTIQAQIDWHKSEPFETVLKPGQELRLKCGVIPKKTWGMTTGANIFLESLDPDAERVNYLKERNNLLRTALDEIGKEFSKFGKLSEAEAIALQTERQKRIAKASSFTKV